MIELFIAGPLALCMSCFPDESPLGPKVPAKPPPAKPEWQPVPGKPHLEQNAKGEWRTKEQPLPPNQ